LYFGGHGIHEIGYDHDCGYEGQEGVEKFQVIAFDGFPHVSAGVQFQEYVVPSFANGHEQGQEEDHDDDPFGEFYVAYYGARFYAKYETCGQQDDIQDGNGFQAEGVPEVDEEVDGEYEDEFFFYGPGDCEAEDNEDGADEECGGGGDGAGSDGSFAFYGVFPVVFDVFVIIEDIDAAGDKAKGDEAIEDADDLMEVQEFACKEKGDEKEEILCPVFGSQEFEISHNDRLSGQNTNKKTEFIVFAAK
jgi:hypothetical protein